MQLCQSSEALVSPHEAAYLKSQGLRPESSPTVGVLEQFLTNAGGTTKAPAGETAAAAAAREDEWGAEPKRRTDLSDDWEGEVRI